MKSTSAVEPAFAAEAATTEVTAMEGSEISVATAVKVPKTGPAIKAMPVVAPSIETAPIESGPAPETVEPRASANENAVHEPVRSVVAVGCARVRIIRIVTKGADRGWSVVVTGPYADSDSKPHLRVRGVSHRARDSKKKP